MSAKNNIKFGLIVTACLTPLIALSAPPTFNLTQEAIAKQLGWVASPTSNYCGGYYLEGPLTYPTQINVEKQSSVEITSNQTLFSQRGTSVLEGKVTATRSGQQMTGNKAYLYRDPTTGKLSSMDMVGNVHLREPNTLVIAKTGHYDFVSKAKSLIDIVYRMAVNDKKVVAPKVSDQELKTARKVTVLTSWGKADQFAQAEPKVYELYQGSYSTCPPIDPTWRLKAKHIVLNKNTGRGYATQVRIMVKNVPVFYTPYLNFSIDNTRKSGFLWPTYGGSSTSGPSIYAPFYWNMAPNYDMILTPGVLFKRGVQLTDRFRYLTTTSGGTFNIGLLPGDRAFAQLQSSYEQTYASYPDATTQAELSRLEGASTFRKGLQWQDKSQFNDHWSSDVNFSYAGDDYYMRDFGNLNEVTQNELLQQADIFYKGQNWNFTGTVQGYQTLHPVDEPPVLNNYRRFPELILNGDYPDQPYGLEFFIANDLTHFSFLNTPGTPYNQPIGNRINVQPGVSLPVYTPWFFINPRLQVALTDYNLYQTAQTQSQTSIHRALPIFDLAAGLMFNRDMHLFGNAFQQTLEPQVYYTYIPYNNQSDIPLFDTSDNTLTYDQLFTYNRFNGLDRIGDANQIAGGVTSRFMDQDTGLEKARIGLGDIMYFENRRVTLCNNANTCTNYPQSHSNVQRFSPLTGLVSYTVNPSWSVSDNSILDPSTKQLDNTTVALSYHPDAYRVVNLAYNYARGGDVLSGIATTDPSNNLKVTDMSFAWPLVHDISVVGRWSQNWNHVHLQNLLYGLQYDTCCWALRVVAGRAFLNIDATSGRPQYDAQMYVQFSLKGLGNIGNGDPTSLLNTIAGYHSQFGQEI